jgi:hypothetical protein
MAGKNAAVIDAWGREVGTAAELNVEELRLAVQVFAGE